MQENKHLFNLAGDPRVAAHSRKKSEFKFQANPANKVVTKQPGTGKSSRTGSLTIEVGEQIEADSERHEKKEAESKQEAASADWNMF